MEVHDKHADRATVIGCAGAAENRKKNENENMT
jgi:hypothetical protein